MLEASFPQLCGLLLDGASPQKLVEVVEEPRGCPWDVVSQLLCVTHASSTDTYAPTSRPQARDSLPLVLAHYPRFFFFIAFLRLIDSTFSSSIVS